jgi:hypothetical protein
LYFTVSLPLAPLSSTFCCFAVSFTHGVSRSMSLACATASSMREKYCVWAPRHGAIAPPLIDKSVSGMTSSGSISNVVPNPSHVSHAPYGELNEKLRGAGSS